VVEETPVPVPEWVVVLPAGNGTDTVVVEVKEEVVVTAVPVPVPTGSVVFPAGKGTDVVEEIGVGVVV